MLTKSPAFEVFVYRALFSASLVYLAVALLVLRPTHSFGLAHSIWAVICGIGSGLAYKRAKQRAELGSSSTPDSGPSRANQG